MTDFVIRRGQRATPVRSPYLGMDDYGNAVFECRFTKRPVIIGNHRISGNTIPQANVCYVAGLDTWAQERESRAAFHESEANCNMCANFVRSPYDRRTFAYSGVFHGRCKIGEKEGEYMVAPDDYMGMACWTPR